MGLILKNVDWGRITRSVRVEMKNREVYQPLISLYRWWARRPHTLMGAVIDAAADLLAADGRVSDPFSGGGTVAIEALRRGYEVYAQDINPWAAWGLKVSLTPVKPEELAQAGTELLASLRTAVGSAYFASCEQHGPSTTVHAFRVRWGSCTSCARRFWVYPYPLLTVASRKTGESEGYFGCRRCGMVSRRRLELKKHVCTECGWLLQRAGHPVRAYREKACPHCRQRDTLADAKWALVLNQQLREANGHAALHLDIPPQVAEPDAPAETVDLPAGLRDAIPAGVETNRLIKNGFRSWADLYPPRQLRALLTAGRLLAASNFPEGIKERLLLVLMGAAEMPGYLCRWDRFHPKIFEAMSNHRYAFDGLAVEPNPMAALGRGSLERRIIASTKAARWLQDQGKGSRAPAYHASVGAGKPPVVSGRVAVVQGSSDQQLLPDGAASLVLTDPPYYDSVQYGELATLFEAWMRAFGIAEEGCDLRKEAVPNRVRGLGMEGYQTILSRIFSESGRTLKPNGRMILTYHSRNLRAWAALGGALAKAGFHIAGLAVAPSENARDHSKRGKRSFVSDLVIECVKGSSQPEVEIITPPKTPQERELLHAGRAIADAGAADYAKVRTVFSRLSCRLRDRRINISTPRDACTGASHG
jgi:adenine-specific DNA methylase/uncharacterized C2H2 Zn-finger protein